MDRGAWRLTARSIGRWSDMLAGAFVRLDADTGAPDFAGRIEQAALPGMRISTVEASGHRITRLPEHVRQDGREIVFVNIQMDGVGLTRRDGAEVEARPFDVTLVDATEPYSVAHRDLFRLCSVALERADLPTGLAGRQRLALSRDPVGREVSSLLLGLARASALAGPGPTATLLSAQLKALLDHAATIEPAAPPAERRPGATTALVLAYLDRNHTREGVGARMAARALGLSARRVHEAVAETGLSVSEHVNARRLDAVIRAMERDPAGARISTLAYDAGYRDLSHFNRRFRRRFGEAPSDRLARLRAGVSADTAPGS